MTDYVGEQEMEMEALHSIFMDDLEEVIDDIPSGWSPKGQVWRVVIAPQQEDGKEVEIPVKVELVFAHTPTYPDDPPLLKARGLQGISDADVGMLQSVLEGGVQENLGMAMIYTLISQAQEWVEDKASSLAMPIFDPVAEERRRRDAEEERLAELRRHGHVVTVEAFAEWKAAFDAEQALERAKLEGDKAEDKKGRPTGKQWFLQQEAAHLEIEEPELEEGEEDGEEDRERWGYGAEAAEGDEDDEEEDLDFDDDSDEEDLLDELLASKG